MVLLSTECSEIFIEISQFLDNWTSIFKRIDVDGKIGKVGFRAYTLLGTKYILHVIDLVGRGVVFSWLYPKEVISNPQHNEDVNFPSFQEELIYHLELFV